MRKIAVFVLCLFFVSLTAPLLAQQGRDEIVILHTNDTHSQIDPYKEGTPREAGGVFRHLSYLDSVRDQYETVFLFHAGDFSQGTPYFNLFHGYPEIQFMNEMAFDAITLGNHEFDNGAQALSDRLQDANFPIVCANYKFKHRKLQKQVKPYVIIEKNGTRVGVFGLMIHLYHMSGAAHITDTAIYLDPIVTAQAVVKKLKRKGCDLIICLSHLGLDEDAVAKYPEVCDRLLAEKVQDIDLIIGGHSHTATLQPVSVGRVQIVQTAGRGTTIGQLILKRR